MMQKKLGRNTVVLLGVGHTNAHVLRMWKVHPLPDAQLVCVSNFPVATYSGMFPGVLAGRYPVGDMEVDLVRLANSAGARLILGEVTGLDPARQRLEFRDRPPLAYDVMSIGIGSRPTFKGVQVNSNANLLAVKPMQTFLKRLKQQLNDLCESGEASTGSRPLKIVIVGGGISSVEIAFCLNQRLINDPEWGTGNSSKSKNSNPAHEVTLLTGSEQIGGGLLPGTRDRVMRQLEQRDIGIRTGRRVASINETSLELADGSGVDADVIIWATSAAPPALVEQLKLETDDDGFIITRPTLQSLSSDRVFVVGDTGTILNAKTAKAGVYAVRQGPALWRNIANVLQNKTLEKYEPQTGFLKLVNTGDDHAIAEYKGLSFYGGWCWKLKDRIDSRFIRMYQKYSPMKMKVSDSVDDDSDPMRCLGCGGKIGSRILSSVRAELDVRPRDNVIIGLDQPDDAAIVRTENNQVTVTTDFFAAPFEDPYLVGRIATLNSASDCFVMGARPTAALAIVQVPTGHPRAQLQVMRELMAGSVEELNRMGAAIVGGHSIEGPRTMIGYTILGQQVCDPKTKSGLRAGDQLVLTKPIGTGVLLAALMQSKLPGVELPELLDSMLLSNEIALRLVQNFPLTSLTDVTGFGLAGHLVEMLSASQASAEISMERIPLLGGVQAMIDSGIESTLAGDNRAVSAKVEVVGADVGDLRTASLFDPQTGGGLLMGIGQGECERLLEFLRNTGFEHSTVIGEVTDAGSGIQLRID